MSDPTPADDAPGTGEVPTLPRTWRPRFARAILALVAAMLVISTVGMWVLMPAEIRADFSWPQAFTLLGFLVAVVYGLGVLARTRVDADEGGLTVVNAFRRHRLEWAQVVGVHLRPGDPWVRMDLAEGDTLGAMGIQSADGARGRTDARELATVVLAQTQTRHND